MSQLLTYLKGPSTFQTFDDNADRKDKGLTHQFHGDFATHQAALDHLNRQGAGVYVTINATDGKGRTAKNITVVRALFVDFDVADAKRVERLLALDVKPTLIIESSAGKHHAYWMVDGIDISEFSACQKQLITYFTAQGDAPDKAVHDLPRVMRVDGFVHAKVKDGKASTPFVSRVLHKGDSVSRETMMAWLRDMDDVLVESKHQSAPVQVVSTHHHGSVSDYVRSQAQGAWQFVLGRLGYAVSGKHEPCPHCGGKDRFRFDNHNLVAGDGGWICSQGNGTTVGGDGLSFLIDHVGMSAKDAVHKVADVLNLTLPQDDYGLDVDTLIINSQKHKKAPTAQTAETCQIIVEDDFVLPKYNNMPDVPVQLLNLPIRKNHELKTYFESFSREPQDEITIAGMLSLLSVLLGRRYVSAAGNTTSIYTMVIGDTGVGKNYVKQAIQAFLSESGMIDLLSGSGSTSSGAVYTALMQSPCHIQIIDEMGKQIQTARKQPNGQMADSFSTLVECYSATTSVLTPRNYSNMSGKNHQAKRLLIQYPAITLLGLATPAQVYDNMRGADIEDGFLNRFNIINISLPQHPKRRASRQKITQEMVDWARYIRFGQAGNLSGYAAEAFDMVPDYETVEISEAAEALFDAVYDELKELEAQGELPIPDMTRRWLENAMRIATLLALADRDGDEVPVIDIDKAGWAVLYVRFYGQMAVDIISTKVADNDFHRLYLAVHDLIKRSGEHGMTERDLARNSRLFASSTPMQREMAFKALLAEGQIIAVAIATISGRGRKRACFILPKYFNKNTMELAQ